MAVALDYLRSHGRRLKAKIRADALFVLRLEVAKGAHSARQLADPHAFSGSIEALQVALHFGVPVKQLQAEGRWLRIDAMGTADGWCVLELERAPLKHFKKIDDAFADDGRRFLDLQRLRRVYNVVGSESVMEPARLRAQPMRMQALCHGCGERDHVVLDFGLDFADALG